MLCCFVSFFFLFVIVKKVSIIHRTEEWAYVHNLFRSYLYNDCNYVEIVPKATQFSIFKKRTKHDHYLSLRSTYRCCGKVEHVFILYLLLFTMEWRMEADCLLCWGAKICNKIKRKKGKSKKQQSKEDAFGVVCCLALQTSWFIFYLLMF